MLVLWLTAVAMFVGGLGAVVSDVAEWDLAMNIGGSQIDIPRDRYAGLMMLILAGVLAAVLRFGGVVVDFVRDHKVAFGVVAVALVASLAVFGGRVVEWLDGGPAVSAAINGDTEGLRALFDAGEVDPTDHGRMLCWAAQRGNVDTLELMLAKGVSPNATREDGTTALSLACAFGGPEAVAVLRSEGASGECNRPPG